MTQSFDAAVLEAIEMMAADSRRSCDLCHRSMIGALAEDHADYCPITKMKKALGNEE